MIRATLLIAFGGALAACPAPPLDEYYPYDATPFDAQPGDGGLQNRLGPPSCTPEAVVDVNARGTRNGAVITLDVDTRTARNDIHPNCVFDDGPERVLRYRVPPMSQSVVAAVRFSTVTDQTRASAAHPDQPPGADPTTFDTVLSIRNACDGRDIDCNNDDRVLDATGSSVDTRRSTVWQVGVVPEDEVIVVLDGNQASSGIAHVTVEEFPRLGVLGAPCLPIPLERALDPTAPTAYFRCPSADIRCVPGAAGDGTDLCEPIVALGGVCDSRRRANSCQRADEGAVCAANPSNEAEVRCAMPGTAPGAPCRGTRSSTGRCDAPLYCSLATPEQGDDTCVVVRQTGESCDPSPSGAINHCADGLSCCVFGDAGDETTCQPSGPGCIVPPPEM